MKTNHEESRSATCEGLSRRGFISGALGTAALLGLAGCAQPKTAEKADEENGRTTSEAPSVPTDIAETLSCDIVIVGAGISGLSAAVQAVENGSKVMVLEAGGVAGGNGAGTEGVFAVGSALQKSLNIEINEVDIIRTELEEGQWVTNGALWYDMVHNSAANIDWLVENGVQFSGNVDNYGAGLYNTMHWFDNDSAVTSYIEPMQAKAEQLGAEFRFQTTASQLKQENGVVCGVYAEDDKGNVIEVNAKAVILASGGIGANPELLCKAGMSQNQVDEMGGSMCSPTVRGDGYTMAMAVGGRDFLRNAAIQGFQMVKAFGTDTTVPYNSPLNGGNGIVGNGLCIWVNQDGRRFNDESLAMTFNMAANLGACLGNRESYALFDQAILDNCGLDETDRKVVEDALANNDGTSVFFADTIDELAEHFNLDVATLSGTVDRYNDFCAQGFDGEFGKAASFLAPISSGPFYIARIDALIVVVDGGIMTNIRSEVLNNDTLPIPGLYAVGLDGAMLWRNVYTQNMPGTAMANNINSGRTAANAAAAYIAG
ncbi:FAD-dependent oxidoreductase [Adlercreutzia caecimuris]|uniref:FAD-dependent oxidoreductase n=1 Tax=Adlercreutzia caecimuris TaxID=671266 RepID=UPI00272C8D90|nr:FAD-dependent oxidoreductase [Adlercreutzia caecimuris]